MQSIGPEMVHSTTPRAFSWPFWENNDFQVMQHVVGVAAIRSIVLETNLETCINTNGLNSAIWTGGCRDLAARQLKTSKFVVTQ